MKINMNDEQCRKHGTGKDRLKEIARILTEREDVEKLNIKGWEPGKRVT